MTLRPIVASVALALLVACGDAHRQAPAAPASAPAALLVGDEVGLDPVLDGGTAELAAAFDGTRHLVVWVERGATGADLLGLRLSADGEPLDAAPFVVSAAPGDEQAPAIASDGSEFLVVWQDHRSGPFMNVYGARVSGGGAVLDPAGFPVDVQVDHQAAPSVAFDGSQYLVAWADHRAGTNWDVYAARVTTGGTVLDPDGFVVSAAPSHQTSPAIAAGPAGTLVVWQDQRVGEPNLHGARIAPSGTVVDPGGLAISLAAGEQLVPAVTADATGFVVAWQDLPPGALASDVSAARVDAGGAVLDPAAVAVAAGPGEERRPALAFDGRDVVVAWVSGPAGAPGELSLARLRGGALLDPAPVAVATAVADGPAALASDGAGRVLAAYAPLDLLGLRLGARVVTGWATLSVGRAGRGAGTVASTPEGIACGEACAAPFEAGQVVTLEAAPDGDSVFAGWTGACAGTKPCSVTVDRAREVVATFLPLHPLTVTLGATPGTVTSAPAGIACGSACTARFPEGTTVALAAQGSPGASVLGAWSGACVGAGPCEVRVDGPRVVGATFVPAVSITFAPTGAGTGAVVLNGTACRTGATCTVDVPRPSTVTLTAAPDAESVVKTWTGCTSWVETTCTLAVTNSARSVTARFDPRAFLVTAQAVGTGAGTIEGGGLACATGSATGCTVRLDNPPYTSAYPTLAARATPAAGSVFKSWSGCTAGADPRACTVVIAADRALSARFEPATWPLAAATTGAGAGTVEGAGLSCSTGGAGACTAPVENPADRLGSTTVTLRAVAAPGSVFKSWSGCAAVAGDPSACTLTVAGARAISARFEPATFPLEAGFAGTGAGTVTGAGLACSTGPTGVCTAAVENPASTAGYLTVALRATAAAGSVFKGWSGCTPVPGDFAACTTLLSAAKRVTARFEPATIPLALAATGTGQGTVTAAGAACVFGPPEGCTVDVPNPPDAAGYATVTVRAEPAPGSVFKSWTGCAAVPGDPRACTVTVSSARTVRARLEPAVYPVIVALTGSGGGTVAGPGVACATGSTEGCTALVANPPDSAAAATLALAATPDASSLFRSWTGCTPGGGPATCVTTVTGPRTVSARFDPSTYPLAVSLSGAGTGAVLGPGISCRSGSSDGCAAVQANGATVVLSAQADTGSILKSWTGCSAAGDGTCTVTMTSTRSVTVTFQPATFALSITFSGTGAGAVDASGASCASSSGGCTFQEPNGAVVTLSATAAPGSTFAGWSGSGCSGAGPCEVSMAYARSVRATFTSP